MEAAKFRAFPLWLLVAETLLALVATPIGLIVLVSGETWQGLLLVALGLVNGASAAIQSQQRLKVGEAGLSFQPASGRRP